jgi:ubiquitin C-terminal hydrolase
LACQEKSVTRQNFTSLKLPTTTSSSLQGALFDLEGVEAIHHSCYTCKEVRAEQRTIIEVHPEVIMGHLLIFDNAGRKIPSAMEIPDTILTSGKVTYQIVGSVNHIGRTINEGHYVYTARVDEDRVLLCNDAMVTEVGSVHLPEASPYLVFYKKTDSVNKVGLTTCRVFLAKDDFQCPRYESNLENELCIASHLL